MGCMVSKKSKAATEPYISRVQLKDIRGFRDLELNFEYQGRPRMRTLIIGQNGTGKTTLLRSIVLALVDDRDGPSLVSFPNGDYVNNQKERGSVYLTLSNSVAMKSTLLRKKEFELIVITSESGWTADPRDYSLFVVAYGTSRSQVGQSRGEIRGLGYRMSDSVLSLFDSDAALTSPELILRRLYDFQGEESFNRAMNGIKRILNLPEEATIGFAKGGGVQISSPNVGENIPLEGWADGYRQTFQWILDFYGWAMRYGNLTPDGGVRGILLIDEIEQHLHPAQQATLMNRLSELFPELQIIATTHSPLVALGVEPHELVVLRREGDEVRAVENVPDFRRYSVEDLIRDDLLFDTPVYSPQMQESLNQYEQLAQKPPETRSTKDKKALAKLAVQVTPTSDEGDEVLQEIRKLREELKK